MTSREPAERWITPSSADGPTILEPVRMRSAGEHIADRIVTAIALGEFVPGQRLPTERDLASMLTSAGPRCARPSSGSRRSDTWTCVAAATAGRSSCKVGGRTPPR